MWFAGEEHLPGENVGNGQEELVRRSYAPGRCSSPANHMELVKVLYQNFLGAFKARVLPSSLMKTSVLDSLMYLSLCSRRAEGGNDNNSKDMCSTCRDVCSYFPVDEIIDQPFFCKCAGEIGVYEIVSKRKGAKEIIRKDSYDYLPTLLLSLIHI